MRTDDESTLRETRPPETTLPPSPIEPSVRSLAVAGQAISTGLSLDFAEATRLDDFGGGNVPLDPNTPPVATILEPADSAFFAEGVTLPLAGAGSDAETPPEAPPDPPVALLPPAPLLPPALAAEPATP